MNMGLRSKLLLMFAFIILIDLANYLLIRSAELQAADQQQQLSNSQQAKLTAVQLLGHLRDAETGQRGFLLTRESEYLAPYRTGRIQSRESLTQLKALIQNTLQQERLLRIEQLVNEQLAELEQTVKLAFNNQYDTAIATVKSDRGKQLMDEIRLEMRDFIYTENHLLNLYEQDYRTSQKNLRVLFIIEAIGLLLILALIGIYLQNRIILPLQRLIKASDKIARGNSPYKLKIHTNDEIGELADAFKEMHVRIKQRELMLDRLRQELEVERDHAMQLATVDSLTGLLNRRRFETVSEKERLRSRRSDSFMFLLLMDIDYFKRINDNYGHDHGDQVLQTVANCLKQSCRRPTDFVFRMGGEEFLVLTSGDNASDGRQFAELLRGNIEAQRIEHKYSPVSEYVTVSMGVAYLAPQQTTTIRELMKQADHNLYEAKARGRNLVVWKDDSPAEITSPTENS